MARRCPLQRQRRRRPAEQQKADGWLAVARSSGSDDDDFCSGGPNSGSDDLRADAAARRPPPMPKLVRQGRVEGRRVGGRSVGGPGYLVGGGTSSSCRGEKAAPGAAPKPLASESRARGSCQREKLRRQQEREGLPREPSPETPDDDDDFSSGGPNSSSDDLRADAAAMRPSPMPSLERQGRAEGRRVEVSPWAAPAISSAEEPLPAAVAEGDAGSGSEATRVREPGTRQLSAPRTANALPPDH